MTDSLNSNIQEEASQDRPILVATDFSDDARAALVWACRFAECTKARLVLLHVVHDPATNPGFYHSGKHGSMQPMPAVAESMMSEFLAEMIKSHPEFKVLKSADTLLVSGLPPGRIVETADMLKAQLIVIGSRGMTGLPHLLLGSVAERVVELAAPPVVVVKAEAPGKKKKEKKAKKDKNRLKNIPERRIESDD